MKLETRIKTFNELTVTELYEMMHLRQEVFVVEQDAAYLDADYKDQKAVHVSIYLDGKMAAYARVLPAGVSYKEVSIGRVVSAAKYRGKALGKHIMKNCIEVLEQEFKTSRCRISAQTYLISFYESFGFEVCSEEYLEDGLPHHEMLKTK